MKIALKNILIDTDEISCISKSSVGITLFIKNGVGNLPIYISSSDYEVFDSLFFLGGLPDIIVPSETILSRKELTSQLAETRRELTEQTWKLQLMEEREQIVRNTEMIVEIEKIGIEAYRKSLQRDHERVSNIGSMFPPENFLKN